MSLPLAGGAGWLQPPTSCWGYGATGDKHRAETSQVLAASVPLAPLQPWHGEAHPNLPCWSLQRSGMRCPSQVNNLCWAGLSCRLLPMAQEPRAMLSSPGEWTGWAPCSGC